MSAPSVSEPAAAPFLLWPVSRREFYRTIWMAMIPTLIWGTVIYGQRAAVMLLASILAASGSHLLLKHILPRIFQRFTRPRVLVYSHSLLTALVLVALAHPLWPVWVVAATAFLVPVAHVVIGGPGRERLHVGVVLVMLVQWGAMPLLARAHTYAGGPGWIDQNARANAPGDAMLARDRLFMGDIREQQAAPFFQWPASRDLGGNDALAIAAPARVVASVLDRAAGMITAHSGDQFPMLSQEETRTLGQAINDAFAFRMPDTQALLLGATPGRLGTTCLIAIAGAGLYLAYRYILRARSTAFFLVTFLIGTLLFALPFEALRTLGAAGLWRLHTAFPGSLAMLVVTLLVNSDAAFAAVFILALPGAEPLTARGRRAFLLIAGLAAASLHRHFPGLPAASICLTALMPFTRLFDLTFAKRSWLNPK